MKVVRSEHRVVYHGSPRMLDEIVPSDRHGDPDVGSVVFATPYREMALAYCGRDWGDRDIEQGFATNPGQWKLREMRPGAFADVFDQGGWLYELPGSAVERPRRSMGSDFEMVSRRTIRPLRSVFIPDVLAALSAVGVVLEHFDSGTRGHHLAVERMAARCLRMDDAGMEEYLSWVRSANPRLQEEILSCLSETQRAGLSVR